MRNQPGSERPRPSASAAGLSAEALCAKVEGHYGETSPELAGMEHASEGGELSRATPL